MRTSRSEKTIATVAADWAAIERWESEGGTALDQEESSTGIASGASSRSSEEDADVSLRALAENRRENYPAWLIP
jgi:hypothetical protein